MFKKIYDWSKVKFWKLVHNCLVRPIVFVLNVISAALYVTGNWLFYWYVKDAAEFLHNVSLPRDAKQKSCD